MVSLWYSDTYAKGMKEGEAKGEARGLAKGEARGSAKRDITFVLPFPRSQRISPWISKRSAASRRPWRRCTSPV